MNLLLEQDKQDIKKGLKNRFIIVLLGAISCAFIIGIITLLPAYFISEAKLSTNNNGNNIEQDKEIISADKSLEIPKEISSKMDLINSSINRKSTSEYIKDITALLPDNLSVDSIVFLDEQSFQDLRGLQIDVSGVALNREVLLKFINSLKESGDFYSVFVPVSDFTKNTDVTFNINLFVNQK